MKLNMQIRLMFLLGFAVIGQGVTLAAACTREAEAPAATPSASDTANQTDAIPAETADALPYQPKAVPTVGPGGTYAERCQKFAAALCGHLENCCFSAVPGCEADLLDECLDPGKFDGLAAAASAGKLVLDPVLAAQCDVAIAAIGATCSKTAMMTVLIPCLFAWTDPAALGQACQDGRGEVCAGGQGRCGPIALPMLGQPLAFVERFGCRSFPTTPTWQNHTGFSPIVVARGPFPPTVWVVDAHT